MPTGIDTFLSAGHEVGRAGAEITDAVAFDEIPEHLKVGILGAAVVEDDSDAGQKQAGDEEIPHHPAGRRVPEKAVALPQVQMKRQDLQVLEKNTAVAVDNRLGPARRSRGIENPERMLERNGLEKKLGDFRAEASRSSQR